jgi:hypothetical protein
MLFFPLCYIVIFFATLLLVPGGRTNQICITIIVLAITGKKINIAIEPIMVYILILSYRK